VNFNHQALAQCEEPAGQFVDRIDRGVPRLADLRLRDGVITF